MIGKVTGRIDYRASDHVLIEAGGLGYLVYCSERTLAQLPAEGMASLYTELVVREDLLQLYGFASLAEREWHRLLTSVQGVGPKAALSILGVLGTEGTARAIALGDAGSIRAAPGIGPKIAQRVILELKGKSPVLTAAGPHGAGPPGAGPQGAGPAAAAAPAAMPDGGATAEALSALVNLGYAPAEAAAAVARAGEGDTAVLIRSALKLLARDRSGA
jgi:Holliday junction DNA helicase RuvA